MCNGCWEEAGRPAVVNEKTLGVQPLIKAVYAMHGTGGNLHIVLDDWNVEDSHLAFCEKAIKKNQFNYPPEQLEAESKCLEALKAMTLEERHSAMAIEYGLVP